jgi:hypothetical protein
MKNRNDIEEMMVKLLKNDRTRIPCREIVPKKEDV